MGLNFAPVVSCLNQVSSDFWWKRNNLVVAIRVQLSCKITVVNLYVPLHLQTFLFYFYLLVNKYQWCVGVLSKYVYVCIDICPTLLIYYQCTFILIICISVEIVFMQPIFCLSLTCMFVMFVFPGLMEWVCWMVCKEPLGLLGLCPPSCLWAMQERWHLSPIILSCRQDQDSPLAAASHSDWYATLLCLCVGGWVGGGMEAGCFCVLFTLFDWGSCVCVYMWVCYCTAVSISIRVCSYQLMCFQVSV